MAHILLTHILSHVLFLPILSHVIYTCIITYILLVAYVWAHDLQCNFSYLAIAFIVVFLELLLIAFHVCPQFNVQLQIVIPTLENKETEHLENHIPLASVVTIYVKTMMQFYIQTSGRCMKTLKKMKIKTMGCKKILLLEFCQSTL